MESPVINTRADLDAIAGTPAHAAFMAMLSGSLWRLQKDEAAQVWVAVEDNSTIERFEFVRADFPEAVPPELPVYSPPSSPQVVTMRQARLALHAAGLLDQVTAAVAAMPGPEGDAARIEWEFSSTVERSRPLVQSLAAALGWSEAQLDALFTAAAAL
jgi:hypothetical protein